LQKRPEDNCYSTANLYTKTDRRYWFFQESMYNLLSSGNWTLGDEMVDLDQGDFRNFGDSLGMFGIYPYKISNVNIEISFLNKYGQLVTFIIQDEGGASKDIIVNRDKMVVEQDWIHIDPTEVIYDDNNEILRIQTFKTDFRTTELNVKFNKTGQTSDSLNFQVVQVSSRFYQGTWDGYFIDNEMEKHDIVGAYGFIVSSYFQL